MDTFLSLVFLQSLYLCICRQVNGIIITWSILLWNLNPLGKFTDCFIQGNLLLNLFKQIENQHGILIDEEIFNLEEIKRRLEMIKTLLSLLLLCLHFYR